MTDDREMELAAYQSHELAIGHIEPSPDSELRKSPSDPEQIEFLDGEEWKPTTSHAWTWNLRADGMMTVHLRIGTRFERYELNSTQTGVALAGTLAEMTAALRVFARCGRGL